MYTVQQQCSSEINVCLNKYDYKACDCRNVWLGLVHHLLICYVKNIILIIYIFMCLSCSFAISGVLQA